jgi:mRNA-degrading endonuclease RelE of RelBE toxin-antitoxin system
MTVVFNEHFTGQFQKAPQQIQKLFGKQLGFLLADLRHPSLRAKIVDEDKRIWQARVNGGWRFYFQMEQDTYKMLEIRRHG